VIDHDWRLTIVDTQLMLIFKMGQQAFHLQVYLSRHPIIRLWQFPTCRPPDYPWYTTNNCWCSVDNHIHDGVGRILQSVLPIKADKNYFMTVSNLLAMWLPRMHDHKSLMACWHSFSRWGREGIAICFAYKGGQKFLSDWRQPIGGVINQDAWPKIVDTLLTHIFKMR